MIASGTSSLLRSILLLNLCFIGALLLASEKTSPLNTNDFSQTIRSFCSQKKAWHATYNVKFQTSGASSFLGVGSYQGKADLQVLCPQSFRIHLLIEGRRLTLLTNGNETWLIFRKSQKESQIVEYYSSLNKRSLGKWVQLTNRLLSSSKILLKESSDVSFQRIVVDAFFDSKKEESTFYEISFSKLKQSLRLNLLLAPTPSLPQIFWKDEKGFSCEFNLINEGVSEADKDPLTYQYFYEHSDIVKKF